MKTTDISQVNLGDLLRAFWRWKIGFLVIIFSLTAGVVLYSYTLSDVYEAEAIILPVSQQSGGSLSTSTLLANIPFFSGGGGSNSFILFLKSKKMAIEVLKGLDANERFIPVDAKSRSLYSEQQILNDAAESLASKVEVKNDRVYSEKIRISVKDADPEFATRIVRQYLAELQNFIANNSLTQAKRYRFFLEGQLAKMQRELLEMGKELAVFYGKNSVSKDLASMKVPVAVESDTGIRNFKSYDEFKNHFEDLQKKADGSENKEVQFVDGVPHQVYLQYLTIQQQVLEQNYTILTQSYQTAKLEEAKEEPSFQVLDEPFVPKNRIFPQRRLFAQAAFGGGCFLGILYVLFAEFFGGSAYAKLISFDLRKKTLRNIGRG